MSIWDNMAGRLFNRSGSDDGELPPLRTAEDQSEDEKKLAAFIKKRVDDSNTAANRISHMGTWLTNIAYVLGFDSVFFDTNTRQFQSTTGSAGTSSGLLRRGRVFENIILPAVQNRQARLCKNPPKFEVAPEDNTNEAKEDARLGHDVLLQLWNDCEINVKRLGLTMWLQECGHSYMKVSFDDELGLPLTDPESGDVIGYEGKVVVEPCSAFEVYPDPLAQTLDQCQWLVQAKVRKLDYFRTRYPERGHLVKEEGAWLMSVQYEQRIQSMNNTGMNSAATQMQMENAAIELSYYEKRSRKHPRGRHVVLANGVILDDKDLAVGEIPFAKFDDILVAGKYYSEATITHARPLQDQYNRTLTRRAMWSNRLLAGKYIAARGHGLHEEALDDSSGEVIEYDYVPGATEPHAVAAPNMPEYAYKETESLKKSLFEIFGLSEVSRGQLPSAGIPAVGMQLLLEQDETRIGIEVEQHEHAYAWMGKLMLLFAARYFKTERNLVKKGIDNDTVISKFTGEDLPKNPQVFVVRGSTIPTSLALRRTEIMNAFGQGLLGNPQDPLVREKVSGMMEYGDTNGLWKDSALDSSMLRRWIQMIEQCEMPQINKGDNHAYLIKGLNDYRKSDKGQDLDPQCKAILQATLDRDVDIAARMANPQMDQMEQNVKMGLTPDGKPLLGNMTDPLTGAPMPVDHAGLAQNQGMAQTESQPLQGVM